MPTPSLRSVAGITHGYSEVTLRERHSNWLMTQTLWVMPLLNRASDVVTRGAGYGRSSVLFLALFLLSDRPLGLAWPCRRAVTFYKVDYLFLWFFYKKDWFFFVGISFYSIFAEKDEPASIDSLKSRFEIYLLGLWNKRPIHIATSRHLRVPSRGMCLRQFTHYYI